MSLRLAGWALGLVVAFNVAAFAADQENTAKPAKPAAEKLDAQKLDARGVEFFEQKIRPVLATNCFQCHSGQAKEIKGNLRLDSRDAVRKGGESGAAIVAGNPDESLLIEALRYEGLEMPPTGKLPENVIADFVKWVEMGAPDPRTGVVRKGIDYVEGKKFWAFQPPKLAAVPQVKDTAWPKSDIDRHILARLEAEGLKPVADADKRTLIRRASLDLIGLPPTPEEVDAFLADNSPAAFAKVVDRLLQSPHFGERWGRHWLDVARYAESTGKERNVPYAFAWRYRDYVIDAFNKDKPYTRFITEQIAGDLLPHRSVEQRNENIVATGFLAIGTKGLNERNREQYILDVVDEQIDVVGRAVLGLTVSCARCHDHKFDPIAQHDYYALAGIFRSTNIQSGVAARGNNKQGYSGELCSLEAPPVKVSVEEKKTIENLEAELAKAEAAVKEAEKATTEKNAAEKNTAEKSASESDETPAKNAKKKKAAKTQQRKEKIAAKTESNPEKAAAEKRVTELQEELKKLKEKAAPKADVAMAVADGQIANSRIYNRGEVSQPGDEVPRGFVKIVGGTQEKINPTTSGRLELAHWLTDDRNPTTARVMVNRIWQHLFGNGLVETTDNFGNLGERPTHPELLDHLAIQFQKQNAWSVKKTIRQIVLSRTYQLSSQHDDKNYTADPANKLVWRMAPRRLEAEAIRDSVLATSGRLELERPQGSPVMQLAAGEIGRNLNLAPIMAKDNHRSIYLPLLRGVVPEMLQVFDMADPSLVVGQREVTTVATQALYMMNSPFVAEHAEHLAKRAMSASGDDGEKIQTAYKLALGRPATSDEQSRVVTYLKDFAGESSAEQLAAWTTFCQTLFASAEFRYVY